MTEEDRSWQIEQFETFSCQRDFSHNWDDNGHDRWRGEAWPSIDHRRELTDGLLLMNSYALLRQNIKRQKINLTFQMIGRYSCPTNVCVIHNSQPPFYSAKSHTYQQPHSSSSTTTTLSSSSPSSTSSSSRLVHVAQSVYTLAHITPSTHWASRKYCLVLA